MQTAEAQLQEAKDALGKMQGLNSASLDAQMGRFTQERRELMEKIEKLTREAGERDKLVS